MSEETHTVSGMTRPHPAQLPLWDVPEWVRVVGVFDLETTGVDVADDRSVLYVHVLALESEAELIAGIANGFEARIKEVFQ